MATVTTTIGRVYSTPHESNAWAWLNAQGAWRKIDETATDGHTNVHLALTAARATNATVSVFLDSDDQIANVYL